MVQIVPIILFEFCGEPKATFTINTIARNIANTVNGSILKFTGDATLTGHLILRPYLVLTVV